MPLDPQLLASLLQGGGKVDGLLQQLAERDPLVAQFLQMLRARPEPAPGPATEVEAELEAEAGARTQRRRLRVQSLQDDLARLAHLNDRVSRALGACGCWGETPGCALCHGQGHPGAYPIEERLFAYFVAPALERKPLPVATTAHQPEQERV